MLWLAPLLAGLVGGHMALPRKLPIRKPDPIRSQVFLDAMRSTNQQAVTQVAKALGDEGYTAFQKMLMARAALPLRPQTAKKTQARAIAETLASSDPDEIAKRALELRQMGMTASADILDAHGRGARRASGVKGKRGHKHKKQQQQQQQDGGGGGGGGDDGGGDGGGGDDGNGGDDGGDDE